MIFSLKAKKPQLSYITFESLSSYKYFFSGWPIQKDNSILSILILVFTIVATMHRSGKKWKNSDCILNYYFSPLCNVKKRCFQSLWKQKSADSRYCAFFIFQPTAVVFTSYNTYRQYYQKFKVQTEPSEPILFYDVEMQ